MQIIRDLLKWFDTSKIWLLFQFTKTLEHMGILGIRFCKSIQSCEINPTTLQEEQGKTKPK